MLNIINKQNFFLLSFFVIIFLSNTVLANTSYFKVSYGTTSNKIGTTTNKVGTIVTDEDDEGFMISGGSLIGDIWGVDFMYYDLGSTSIKVDAKELFVFEGNNYLASSSGTITNDISGYGGGLYISSSNDSGFLSFSGSLRIGMHAWDKSGSTSILDNNTAFESKFYNKGIGAYAGLGISLNLTDNLAADISYDMIGINNMVSFDDSSTMGSIGLKYNF